MFRGFTEAGAKDMDGAIAVVAVHDLCIVSYGMAGHTRLLHVEQLVIDDQGGIDLSLLLFVLDGVGVIGRRVKVLAQLDHVELGTADGTAVGSLDPWLQAGIVQVVSTGEEMCNDFVVFGELGFTACYKLV